VLADACAVEEVLAVWDVGHDDVTAIAARVPLSADHARGEDGLGGGAGATEAGVPGLLVLVRWGYIGSRVGRVGVREGALIEGSPAVTARAGAGEQPKVVPRGGGSCAGVCVDFNDCHRVVVRLTPAAITPVTTLATTPASTLATTLVTTLATTLVTTLATTLVQTLPMTFTLTPASPLAVMSTVAALVARATDAVIMVAMASRAAARVTCLVTMVW
jgi:hypothetical protein